MKLTPVDVSIPPVRSAYKQILTEFVESDDEVAEVTEYETSINNVTHNLRKAVERNDMPVRVFQRKGRIFLVKTEQL